MFQYFAKFFKKSSFVLIINELKFIIMSQWHNLSPLTGLGSTME